MSDALGDDFGVAVAIELAEEAAAIALVADGAAFEFGADQQRVAIAIDAQLAEQELLAAGLALESRAFCASGCRK